MDFFDKLDKANGGYIFLSHSHSDIEKVRKLRNALEESGFEPLCFYLKCLNEDSEIEDLIKREIDAREWFIFANSENSRNSKWVSLEREYILKTNSKKILVVNIEDESAIDDTVQKIKHNLRVFLSYSARDRAIAERLKRRLDEKDYLTFWDKNLTVGGNWAEEITSNIISACQDGCVIALITENSIHSDWVTREIDFAIRRGGNILPIFVGNVTISETLRFYLDEKKAIFLSECPTDEEIAQAVDKIGQVIVNM